MPLLIRAVSILLRERRPLFYYYSFPFPRSFLCLLWAIYIILILCRHIFTTFISSLSRLCHFPSAIFATPAFIIIYYYHIPLTPYYCCLPICLRRFLLWFITFSFHVRPLRGYHASAIFHTDIFLPSSFDILLLCAVKSDILFADTIWYAMLTYIHSRDATPCLWRLIFRAILLFDWCLSLLRHMFCLSA